jgi:DNA replication protein DnaC
VLKDLDSFIFADTPADQGQVRELAKGDFLDAKRNIILIGGTGKTHLAIAIAAAVIRARALQSRRSRQSPGKGHGGWPLRYDGRILAAP